MKTISALLFLIISFGLFAQNANTKHMMIFDDCSLEAIKSKVDKAPEFMGGQEELANYFISHCKNKSLLSTLEGKVFLQILINTNGRPCCRQIANKTGEDISGLKLKELIDEMPVWRAAENEEINVNFSAFLILEFNEGQCKVTYNKSEKSEEKKEYNIPYYSIEEALKYLEKAKTLNLSNKELKEVDPQIGKLIYLQVVNLGNNQLKNLPAEIGQLKNLEFLYLTNNQFKSFPSQVGELTKLKALMLNNNKLTSLPNTLGNFKNLRILNISGNKIPETNIEKIKELLPECHIIQ